MAIYDECPKCSTKAWLEEHHILPKASFGNNDETTLLCPNCHRDYHKQLGQKNLKNPDMEFHLYFFSKWFYGLLGLGIFALWWFL